MKFWGRSVVLLMIGGAMLFAAEAESAASTPMEGAKPGKECNGKLLIGEAEWVYLPAAKMKLKARIDTGATTTSVDARDLRVQERDGKKWAMFTMVDRENDKKVEMEKPVEKVVEIKRHGTENQKRYAVKMRINLGNVSRYITVTLNDRENFEYPVLIGRNFLRGSAVVDVDEAYTVEPTKEEK